MKIMRGEDVGSHTESNIHTEKCLPKKLMYLFPTLMC